MSKPLTTQDRKRILDAHAMILPLIKQYVATSPAIPTARKTKITKAASLLHVVLDHACATELGIAQQHGRRPGRTEKEPTA